jgi:hypothetical protein
MNVKSWHLGSVRRPLVRSGGLSTKALVSRGRLEYLDARMRQRWEEAWADFS